MKTRPVTKTNKKIILNPNNYTSTAWSQNTNVSLWVELPKQDPIQYHCYTCGILIEGTAYTDASGLEMAHGGGVQCKSCYLAAGHWQCSCSEWMLLGTMKFCHQCGKERRNEINEGK